MNIGRLWRVKRRRQMASHMRNHMVVSPLSFLITCHTSCTEHSRSFPPGPPVSTDYKKSQFPLGRGPGKGWPNNRKPFWQYSPYISQIPMAKIILHLPIVLIGPNRELIPPHTWPPCSSPAESISSVSVPLLMVSEELGKELISHSLPDWRRQCQLPSLVDIWVAEQGSCLPSPTWCSRMS